MGTKTIRAAIAAMCVATALPSWAADRTINADYTLTADETVDGVLTVESGVTVDLNGHRLTVKGLAGTGTITSPGELPDVVASKCCFWLDAADVSTISTNASGQVLTWTSKDSTHRVATSSSTKPVYDTTTYSRPTVDFGAAGSGKDMTYTRFTNLRTVFWAVKIQKTQAAFLLGDIYNNKGLYHFHRGADGLYGYETAEGKMDRTQFLQVWNGEREVAWKEEYIPDDSLQIITATLYRNCCSDSLTKDRNISGRNGGKQLFELICFPDGQTPTDDERVAIIRYLQWKWEGANTTGELCFSVADGETGENSGVALTGNLKVVKVGDGTFTASKSGQTYKGGTEVSAGCFAADSSTALGLLGTASVASGAELSLAADGGEYGFGVSVNGGQLTLKGIAAPADIETRIGGIVSLSSGSKICLDANVLTAGQMTLATGGFSLESGVASLESCVEVVPSAYSLIVDTDENTLTVARPTSPVSATWTGRGNLAVFADPDNWVCRNVNGDVLEGDVVPNGETRSVSLATNCDWRAFGAVTFAPYAVIDLCGHVLSISALPTAGEITSSASFLNADQPVPEIVNSAVFWLDASDAETISCDGDGNISTWTSKDANHVVASTYSAARCPLYDTTSHGRPVVDLGHVSSSRDMTYSRFTNLRTVFAVVKMECSQHAFLLGDAPNSSYHFHRGPYGEYGSRTSSKFSRVWNGLDEVDWRNDTLPNDDFQLIAAVMSQDCASSSLTRDRSIANRSGGKLISEIICFSSTLTDEQRTAVTLYLKGKWFADTNATGELRIEVAGAENTMDNTSVALTGNMKVVKDGAGTFLATKSGQTYYGGTLVRDGVLKYKAGTDVRDCAVGTRIGTITVSTNGVLELNGSYAQTANVFVLDGGVIRNTGADVSDGNGQFTQMRLTSDSRLEVSNSCGFWAPGTAGTSVDLGGHKLTVDIADGKHFMCSYTRFLNGELDVSGGTLQFGSTVADTQKCPIVMTNATMRLNSAIYAYLNNSSGVNISIRDYEALYDGSANTGTTAMNVSGVFTPVADGFYGCALQNGATLDLSRRTGTWSTLSSFTTGSTNVTFAAGAEVTVALGEREDLRQMARRSAPYLVEWPVAAPAETVSFKLPEALYERGYRLRRDASGLKLYNVGGMVIIVK